MVGGKIALFITSVLLLGAFHKAPGGDTFEAAAAAEPGVPDSTGLPLQFGWGRIPTPSEIAAWDIDVSPDGSGLPAGVGRVETGKVIFTAKCAACHGVDGTGGANGALVTPAADTLGKRKEKTIGNYWPYATTVYDYIRRAMPFNQPGTLTDEEVYHLTAFLLCANKIIPETAALDAALLSTIEMPARKMFVPDDRKGGPEIR